MTSTPPDSLPLREKIIQILDLNPDVESGGVGQDLIDYFADSLLALFSATLKEKEEEPIVVNRIELINHTKGHSGREFVQWDNHDFAVKLDLQDNGRTLKIFLSELSQETKERKEDE